MLTQRDEDCGAGEVLTKKIGFDEKRISIAAGRCGAR
jgi:hypothetical protein